MVQRPAQTDNFARGWLAGLALLSVFLVDPARSQTAPNDKLIVPGVRVGPIALGMRASDLYRTMGDPKKTTQINDGTPGGTGTQYFWGNDANQGLWVTVRTGQNVVGSISISSPAYATTEGIHVGSSELAERSLLGQPEQNLANPAPPSWSIHRDCYRRGLLIIDTNGVITAMGVWPNPLVCPN